MSVAEWDSTDDGAWGDLDPAALSFEDVVRSANVASREQVRPQEEQYDPVEVTAGYAARAIKLEEAWPTTLAKAREALLSADPRALYLDFIVDLASRVASGNSNVDRLAVLLEQVAIRGLGMTSDEIVIRKPAPGAVRWQVHVDRDAVKAHLESHVLGETFLSPIKLEEPPEYGDDLVIGSSDVSQHTSAVPVPAKYFRRSVPFVLNNAAGAVLRFENGSPRYENVFNPRPDEALLRWMLIDPSYQDELDPEDYRRCLASAMDVGQYRFDLEYLLKADRPPHIILRDGSLFPQDAYLDNYVADGRRAEFTREAIRELLSCLLYSRNIGTLYCGVTKNVQLRVYSALVDWFISRHIDPSWQLGSYVLNDGQAMSVLLASPNFVDQALSSTVATCLIKRSFTTRANLNTRTRLAGIDTYFDDEQQALRRRGIRIDIAPYRSLCDLAHLWMLFVGHSRHPSEQLPRYEFFAPDNPPALSVRKLLRALQRCGFTIDTDHSFMTKDAVRYLIPSVTQQAHLISKDVGKHIDSVTGQWIMARFRKSLQGGRE